MTITKEQQETAEAIKAVLGVPPTNECLDEEDGALELDWEFDTGNQFSLSIHDDGWIGHTTYLTKGHGTTADFGANDGVIVWYKKPSKLPFLVELFKRAQGEQPMKHNLTQEQLDSLAKAIKSEFGVLPTHEFVDEEAGSLDIDWTLGRSRAFSISIYKIGRVGYSLIGGDYSDSGVLDWTTQGDMVATLKNLFDKMNPQG